MSFEGLFSSKLTLNVIMLVQLMPLPPHHLLLQ